MKRFMLVAIICAALSYMGILFFPWWIPMPVAFVLGLVLPQKTKASFLSPALGTAALYLILCVIADYRNETILSSKMAKLFHMPSFVFMHLFSVLVGFITAGIGGLVAGFIVKAFSLSVAETSDED